MVSIRYLRQQQDEAARNARLVAARRVAADAAVRNARRYDGEKRQQQLAVRAECEARWRTEQQEEQLVVQQLIDGGLSKQGQGMRQAVAAVEAERTEAHVEAAAWEAEARLETTRHRMAVAAQRVAKQQQEQPSADLVERKRLVRELERERTAQVLAAPRGPTYEDVRAELTPSHNAEERRAMKRANTRGGVLAAPGTGSPRPLVDVPQAEHRFPYCPEDAAEVEERQVRQMRTERESALQQQREEASRRATEALREQRRQAALRDRELCERRDRQKAVALEYRGPPPPPVVDSDVSNGASGEGAAWEAAGGGGGATDKKREDPVLHPATYRQRVLQAVREAEDEFERVFVRGPPVLLREHIGVPECAPRCLDELLQPACVADLMPTGDRETCDVATAAAAAAAAVVRVQPCRFQTQPVAIDDMTSGEEEEAGQERDQEQEPERRTAEELITVAQQQQQQPSPQDGVVAAEVPQPPVVEQLPSSEALFPASCPQTSQPLPPHKEDSILSQSVSRISASAEQEDRPVVDVSHLTAPTANVTLSSPDASPASLGARRDPSPTSSISTSSASSSSSTSAPGFSSAHGSCDMSTTMTSSATSFHERPTMTAEQLRIALTRLRQRMRTAHFV